MRWERSPGVLIRVVKFAAFVFVGLGLASSASAVAAPRPVDPIEVLSAAQISEPRPWAAPGGEQFVTWNQLSPAGSVRLIERIDGGPFSEPLELSTTANAEPPDLSFTPDGGVYAIWGIATSGSASQQAIRPPGGQFSAATSIDCRRFVDSASGPGGEIAVACPWNVGPGDPSTVRLATLSSLAPLTTTVGDDLIQPVYDSFLSPRVEWGADGTLGTAFDQTLTLTSPPPVNETTRVRVVLSGPGLVDTADLIQVTEPDRVTLGGLAISSNGAAGVSYSSDAGPLLRVRSPGPVQPYASFSLSGEEAMGPVADGQGNIHVVSVVQGPARAYYANVWTPGDPAMLAPVEIPLAGTGDPYIPYEQGFQVAPSGTEYALMTADDGVYATSRESGESVFATPVKIGPPAESNPMATVNRDGDFLVTWPNGAAGNQKLIFGGLDSGRSPDITIVEAPTRLADRTTGTFSATATDAMGLRSTGWNFGDGTTVSGDTAEHAFARPGTYRVLFTAIDRAGNRSVEQRFVEVPVSPDSIPTMTLKTPKKIKFRAFKKRGLRIVVTGRPKVRIRAVLGTSKRNARLRPMATRLVRRLKNRHVIRIKPRRARLGKRRSFRLYVQATGTTARKKRDTKARVVRVRR